ncbi:MAG: tetraacyldisaccharide 4'-kinase [Marinomonas sp.]
MNLEALFNRAWYGRCHWTKIFLPLMPFIKKAVRDKRSDFLAHSHRSYRAPVPVIVVGNITVGGTGKSPMVVALCELLKSRGLRPGIVSRGHGVKLVKPILVDAECKASQVGDEPAMLARRTQCPTVVYPKRVDAIKHLMAVAKIDVIVCDDGMQHYALNRDIEIAMVDAERGLGNAELLPVGPLREPEERLNSVDYIVSVTKHITPALSALRLPVVIAALSSDCLVSLDGRRRLAFADAFSTDGEWHLMAGIGNPERFVIMLKSLGLKTSMTSHWFADHHAYTEKDIPEQGRIVMTEKDAIKCQNLTLKNTDVWYLPVSLALPEAFTAKLLIQLQHIIDEKQHE